MLLLALVFYLKYEAPPDEQNFPMVDVYKRQGVYQPKKEIKESKIPIALTTFLKANPRIKTIFLHLEDVYKRQVRPERS